MAHQLQKIFQPKVIAARGASDREGTVGNALIKNLLSGTFSGQVIPVNPGHNTIQGVKSYPSVLKIPEPVDLAVIAAPAKWVPKIVKECGEAGIKGLVIISAGFKEAGEEGQKMYQDILETSRAYNMRIIGPNCLGFINPKLGLNASFATRTPSAGRIAFISQSGALCTAILDWSIDQSVGFSHFVSIGSMLDVGFHDLIDYLGSDPNTSSILIYMESLKNPRRFMSAARAFARHKPIIVLKAGKSEAGAKASLSHTGSLAGNDAVFRTAFQRAGVLQVDTIQQLFDCAQALAMQPLPKGDRLAIVTNAGGPGVLATDYLSERGGKLSALSDETIGQLNGILPEHWSHGNPVDVLGDANAKRYLSAVKACADDKNVDAILAILTTQAVTDPADVARALVLEDIKKPILACWMGEGDVYEAREILEKGRIPNYRYPENVVDVFLKMYQYSRNLELLHETPPDIPEDINPDKEKAAALINGILDAKRYQMTEEEAKQLLQYYEIAIPRSKVVSSAEEAVAFSKEIGFPVVMKIASKDIGHKTNVGGVKLNIQNEEEAEQSFNEITANARHHRPDASIEGVMVEKMIQKRYEILIGAKKDPILGPVVVFGSGGILVELFKDTNMGLVPLNMVLAKRIMENTKVYELLKGYRGMPGVDLKSIQFLLVKFAYLLMDFPQIKEVDINPYVVDENGGLALDAHIVLDENWTSEHKIPYEHLVISPYPTQYERAFTMKNGQKVLLRAIRPEDEPMEEAMFEQLSRQSIYFRFFGYLPRVDHELLIRFTQIDYDREMAIIAVTEEEGKKKMIGVVRIISDPWNETAEYAIVVADPWQGNGLGTALTDFILEIARERGIGKVYAEVLSANDVMIHMLANRGFSKRTDGVGVNYMELELEHAKILG
jgi:acetyltransferase